MHDGVGDAELREPRIRLHAQRTEALERHHLAHEARQNGGRIAGARADLHHAMAGLELQRLQHDGEIARRLHRLAAGEGQDAIALREIAQGEGNENLALHRLDGAQHIHVAHARLPQGEQQRAARLEGVRVAVHQPRTSASLVMVGSSVMSRRSGVTEIFFAASASRSVPAPGV